MTDITVKKMNMIDQLYENNYKKNIKTDKSSLSNKTTYIDSLRINLMTKSLFSDLDIAEVRKSEIHGNGVFAKRDIKINEIITFYPAHILQLYIGNDESILAFSNKIKEKYGNDSINHINNHYRYSCNNRNELIGDPTINDNSNYLGHIINDSIMHNKTKKSRKLYNKLSNTQANCDFNNLEPYYLYIPIISKKFIKKDEELYVSYGVQYWDNI